MPGFQKCNFYKNYFRNKNDLIIYYISKKCFWSAWEPGIILSDVVLNLLSEIFENLTFLRKRLLVFNAMLV